MAEATGFDAPQVWQPRGRGFRMGVVPAEGHVVYLTGQVAWDGHEAIVGLGDVGRQTDQCFDNIENVLAACGGRLADIVSLTTYYTSAGQLPLIQAVRGRRLAGAQTVSTSVMVAGVGHPDFLVELTPIASIPEGRFRRPLS